MKNLLLPYFLLSGIFLSAQVDNSPVDYYDADTDFKVGIDGYYGVNSTALTTEYTKAFARGIKIKDETKERISRRLQGLNLFGGDVNVGGFFVVSPDSLLGMAGTSWYGGLRHRENFNGVFSEDFFNLDFFGNSGFKGDTANLSGFEFNLLRYQQLEAGVIFNEGSTGIGFSLLKGQEHQNFEIPLGAMYTAPNAEFVDLDLLMNVRQTDRNKRGFHYINGIGASIDFFTNITFGTVETPKHRMLLEVRDLGLMRWNSNATRYKIDSTYHFNDLLVDNIFTLRDSVFGSQFSDSSLAIHASTIKTGYTTILPAILHVAEIFTIHEGLKLMGGIKYRLMANYNLYYYVCGSYRISPYFEITIRTSYGGYGGLNSGMALKSYIKEQYTITLGSENLEGFLLPSFTGGNSAFLSFQRRF